MWSVFLWNHPQARRRVNWARLALPVRENQDFKASAVFLQSATNPSNRGMTSGFL
jgi:hypothetical protein